MFDFLETFLPQLHHWLDQPIATAWLLLLVLFLMLIWLMLSMRNKKRINELSEIIHELEILKATNSQEIHSLLNQNGMLVSKVEKNLGQTKSLIAQLSKLQNSRDEISNQLSHTIDERTGLQIANEQAQKEISRMKVESREQRAQLHAEQEKLVELKSQFNVSSGK